jgi:hypothetical protein
MEKIAAIWARISTPEQESLESQIGRATLELENKGYTVPPDRILAVDWTSLDLFSCPSFQRLREWIKGKEIKGLGILDRDRLEAVGLQRLVFLSECKEAGIELVICQGPPILDEPEGQLVELALAIGKERSVLRARQGSKDGLHDRAVKRRLPTSRHKLYGYRWQDERRLVPDENWPSLKLIFDMLLEGATYNINIQELKKRGILSPSGASEWNKAALSNFVHNPVYAGRYYALKKEATQPITRRGKTYGNSSQRRLPLQQWHYLPEIEITNPPVTWEQRLQILDQLDKHQKLSSRNGRRDYLLRGLIVCETHQGKKGEPRRYHGQPHRDSWRYTCPVGGCAHAYLNGPKLEEAVKTQVWWLINLQPDEFYEHINNKCNKEEVEQSLQKELLSLEAKYNRNINAETELENRNLLGLEHPEVYRRLKTRFQDERIWIEERKVALLQEQSQLDFETAAAMSLKQIQAKVGDRLNRLTKAEWRELFIALNLEIHIRDSNDPNTWPDHWWEYRITPGKKITQIYIDGPSSLSGESGIEIALPTPFRPPYGDEIEICFGLPLKNQRISGIVFNAPEPG